MAPRSGRYVNRDPTPANFVELWNAIAALQDLVASHTDTLNQHTSDLSNQSGLITGTQQVANQAVILAGKAVDQAATTVPAPGSGGGGGGGTGDAHPNHLDLITQAKNELVALGENLTGPCNAFKIVRRAMPWIQASDPTAGFLSRASATPSSCTVNGTAYAVDIVCYSDGIIYDVLIDSGGANTPMWSFAGTVDPGRYRATT